MKILEAIKNLFTKSPDPQPEVKPEAEHDETCNHDWETIKRVDSLVRLHGLRLSEECKGQWFHVTTKEDLRSLVRSYSSGRYLTGNIQGHVFPEYAGKRVCLICGECHDTVDKAIDSVQRTIDEINAYEEKVKAENAAREKEQKKIKAERQELAQKLWDDCKGENNA